MATKKDKDKIIRLNQKHFETILEIGRVFNSSLNIDEVLNTVIDKVIEVMNAERGFLMLVNQDTGYLEPLVARNMEHKSIQKENFEVSSNIVYKSLQEKSPILCSNAMEDPNFNMFESVTNNSILSILCVPMINKDRVIGIIYVDSTVKPGIVKEADQEMLKAISYHAATAIENARLYEESRNTIKALANAIEARDRYTKGHVERVSKLAVLISKELGFSEDMIKEVETASILHDIGKIGIKDNVLSKPGKLTEDEMKEIQKHPPVGANIIAPIGLSGQIKASIRHHQEKFDGTGYPDNLKGEEIPILARILAVADTFDAMTTERPYRKAVTQEKALIEIKKNAGTQFDPSIVKAFLNAIKKSNKTFNL